ncbi:MAG: tetratricopeptide repeat protein, partial [Planctomycetota bacterium]
MKKTSLHSVLVILLVSTTCCRPADRNGEGTRPQSQGKSAAPPNALDLCLRAEGKLAAGDADGALKDLEGASQLDPKFQRIFHLKGAALMELGRGKDAKEAFVTVIALDHAYADIDFLEKAGLTFVEQGEPQIALNIMNRAQSLTPALMLVSAKAKAKLGDFQGARRDLDEALASPQIPEGAEAFRRELEKGAEEQKTHYVPAADPERLGKKSMELKGSLALVLPRDFSPRVTSKGAKARAKSVEATLAVRPYSGEGEGLEAWRKNLESASEKRGILVKNSMATELAGHRGFFLHLVEPGPESGMFDPFMIIRYQWVVEAPGGAVT